MGELVLALRSRAAAIRNGQLASVIFMRTRIPKKLHVSSDFKIIFEQVKGCKNNEASLFN